MGPELQLIDNAGVFWGALFGLLLSLPIALFLSFWMSAVRNRAAVVFGAFLGGIIGFLIILGWAGTLIYDTVLPGASGGPVFFGSVLFCSAVELAFGMGFDLLIARVNRHHYRRAAAAAHE
ncbi:MAG TPA: PTS sucrose transporter subunit IIBC [Ktedonobacteraceae bacterium]|nr:PTS sucrose transporter subunit IIBC [Ktedonobacteraceae bacterium]